MNNTIYLTGIRNLPIPQDDNLYNFQHPVAGMAVVENDKLKFKKDF
jgi:hypothetical protein